MLAQNAAAGEPTAVVTATWAAGTHRAAELVDVPLDEAVGRLVEHLRELRPDAKVAAVLAHRSEVDRGALPGLVAGLPPEERERLLGTEWYLRMPLAADEG